MLSLSLELLKFTPKMSEFNPFPAIFQVMVNNLSYKICIPYNWFFGFKLEIITKS